jgi:hypothetical protein
MNKYGSIMDDTDWEKQTKKCPSGIQSTINTTKTCPE